jgi:hypothetical protein
MVSRGQNSSESLPGRSCSHTCTIKQDLEIMTQAYSACDTLGIFRGIIASQQKSIDGSDRLPSLIMSRKEGDLFHAHPIGAYETRTI